MDLKVKLSVLFMFSFYFHCEARELALMNSGVISVVHCPKGWVRYKLEKCFKKFTINLSYTNPKQECELSDSTLASIGSEAEHKFLLSYIAKDVSIEKLTNFWIGGMRKGKQLFWEDLSQFDYINWWPGHPDVNTECIWLPTTTVYFNENEASYWGKMATRNCADVLSYMCQKYQSDTRQLIFIRQE